MNASLPCVLTINGGSSSIRFVVYEAGEAPRRRLDGKIDRIGLRGTNLIGNDPTGTPQAPRPVAARRPPHGHPVYYTAWSSSSNPRAHLHDEPYTAAVVVKTMMEVTGLVQGYSFWTFTDIFEENYMPATAFQGGFGLLTLQGVPKPSFRAFELLHRLGIEALPVTGEHGTVDVWVVRGRDAVTVLLTNHVLPRHPIRSESIHIQLTGLLSPRNVYIERIDDDHANARKLWVEMGSPALPRPREVEQMRTASQLMREPLQWNYEGDTLDLGVTMPAHAIAAITVELTPRRGHEDA